MTQTPQLPPNPPPEPLDAAEREVARALRNLPSASPPPELDARILGAARRAVHLAQPRKLRWGRSIGIGTAASALLAVGLFVKMHGSGQDMQVPMPSSEPANELAVPPPPRQEAGPAPHAFAPSMAIRSPPPPAMRTPLPAMPAPIVTEPAREDMVAPAPVPRATVMAPPVPPAQPADAGSLAGKPAASAFPAAPPPERGRALPAGMIEPPPPPPPVVQEAPMQAIAPAPPPPAMERPESKVEAFTASPRDTQNQPAAAATTVGQGELDKDALQAAKKSAPAAGGNANPTGSANPTDAAKAKNLDTVTVTGSRVRRVDTETASPVLILDRKALSLSLPPVEEDSRLAPAQWIDRIRARVKADDGDAARESLRRFHARYPDVAIPDDLQPLLH